jgi:NADPH:quinone reductase-like Zn-dependent oxidoreductase
MATDYAAVEVRGEREGVAFKGREDPPGIADRPIADCARASRTKRQGGVWRIHAARRRDTCAYDVDALLAARQGASGRRRRARATAARRSILFGSRRRHADATTVSTCSHPPSLRPIHTPLSHTQTQPTQKKQVASLNPADPTSGASLVRRPAPSSPPAPGHARLSVLCRPCNPSDVFSLMGVYPGFNCAPGAKLPAVPGIDGVARVSALGDGDSGAAPLTDISGQPLAVGDRVVSAAGFDAAGGNGSWQETVDLPASALSKVPQDSISDAAASSFFVNPVTVVGLLESAAVPKGGWLIVTSALSALSKVLLSAAKARGVKTIGVVRREEAVDEALKCGATAAVCWPGGGVDGTAAAVDLASKVREATGGELAHAAVDSVAGELTGAVTDALRDGGTVLVYGAQGGLSASASVPALLFRDVRVHGFWLGPWLDSLPEGGRARVAAEVWSLYSEGHVSSADEDAKLFPLSAFAKAVAESQRPARGGKVFLVNE